MSYYTVGKYPLVKTFSKLVLPHAPSPLRQDTVVSLYTSIHLPIRISSLIQFFFRRRVYRNIQQHQLALDRLRASTQRHRARPSVRAGDDLLQCLLFLSHKVRKRRTDRKSSRASSVNS